MKVSSQRRPGVRTFARLTCTLLSSATFVRSFSAAPMHISELPPVTPSGVYIHIPFCRRRCHYCDFPIKVIGDKPSARRSSGEYYTDILIKDIDRWTKNTGTEGTTVDSIYFGGGTPSLLPDQCITQIMDVLRRAYKVDAGAEVTLEMDPGTFNYDRLQLLRDSGINRISMGVQSFDNAMLKHCGRPHSAEDTLRALDDLHRASWDNFSIDLISSLPHLTPELWEETLAQASKCGAAHISVYDLQVEPGTAFARWYSPGIAPLPTEVASAEMYRTAVRTLRGAGFEHYEVSNYALPGRRSRHNQKYWQCAPVMAFGMSAASYLQGQRFVRPRKMQEYEKYVQDLAVQPSTAPAMAAKETVRTINTQPDMLDVVMLALRTADGLDLARFARQYGEKNAARVLRALERYEADGLVLRTYDDGRDGGAGERRVRLSDPDGLMLSNDIISSVFASLPSSAESE